MKNKRLVFILPLLFYVAFLSAQKKTTKKVAPEQYFSESGIPLRLEEKKDKAGKLTEKIFYRDRGKVKSDTINEKQLFKNGKISEVQFYTGEGKISYLTKYNTAEKASETISYESNGAINERDVYTQGADGTTKTVSYSKDGNIKSSNITDEEGRILLNINFKADGTVSGKEVCKYDGKINGCKKNECLSYNENNILVGKEINDHQANRRETTHYFNSGKIESFKIEESDTYGVNRHTTEMATYKEDGSCHKQIMQSFKKSWGKRGGGKISVPSEITEYSADGKLTLKLIYKYDDKGNELESTQYDANGKLLSNYVYKNDDNGNKLEETGYDAAGKMFYKDVYKNDSNGNALEIIRNKPDGTTQYIMKDGKYIK